MEIAEFIAESILGLKWVVFLSVVLWKFRDPITSLINQITNIKVSGTSVEFDMALPLPQPKNISGDARALADGGDAEAQYNLGYQYLKGLDVSKDYKTAVAWYRKAADQGYAEAQAQLGVMYAFGIGVPQDYVEAVAWYRKAADGGYGLSQFMLGAMYDQGKGVPQDNEMAYMWFNLAASRSTGEDRDRGRSATGFAHG